MKVFENIFAVLLSVCLCGCSKTETTAKPENAPAPAPEQEEETGKALEILSGTYTAEIVVKDYGTIVLELDADSAPITVSNFVDLANGDDALYIHAGLDPTYCQPYMQRLGLDNKNLLLGKYYGYAYRLDNGLALEHTLYMKGESIAKMIVTKMRNCIECVLFHFCFFSFKEFFLSIRILLSLIKIVKCALFL